MTYQVRPFEHNGEQYEVRIAFDGSTFYVRAFKDGIPANGFQYQISAMMKFDIKQAEKLDPIDYFIKSAKEDVVEGRWEAYLEAVKTVEGIGK